MHPPRFTSRLLPPKPRDLALETPPYLPVLPWYKADSDLDTNSETSILTPRYDHSFLSTPTALCSRVCPIPRRNLRARGFLRASPRGCCHPNHGTSCVILHRGPVIRRNACVCPCTGLPPRFTPRLLLPKPRDLVRETPPYRCNAVCLPVHGASSEVASTQTTGGLRGSTTQNWLIFQFCFFMFKIKLYVCRNLCENFWQIGQKMKKL